jgi:hypothetical protein
MAIRRVALQLIQNTIVCAPDIGDVPRDLAEAALAHSLNATEGTYRTMTAVERRREVMTRYADWLNDERGKVLAFPTGKIV